MSHNIQSIIIAVDGYSSCGKSTVAKDLARLLKIAYIDTGAMYRAVTLFAINNNLIQEGQIDEKKLKELMDQVMVEFKAHPETGITHTWLNGIDVEEKIRGMEVSNLVSPISTLKFVREKLVEMQRLLGKKGGVVLDGRDIGTVVFPNAHLKIFMTASPEIRAERRFKEMKEKNIDFSYQEVMKNLTERDRIDTTRKESPLRQAEDALVLDNSHLNREEQLQWILNKLREKDWL
jgi:cytidylate kinase